MLKHYTVEYGLDVNRKWYLHFNNMEDAVVFATAMVHHPHSWSFSSVYDNKAVGGCKLVWSDRNGHEEAYRG